MKRLVPVLTVVAAILALWYVAVVPMNRAWVVDQAARAGAPVPGFGQLIPQTMNLERPVLPAPHQVVAELWKGVTGQKVTSKRSLVYHAWVTLSATFIGFAVGAALGIALAVGIVYSRAMDLSVLPWAIASQMVPIVALAPMLTVVMSSMGFSGQGTKAVISAYLSFFPVVVGMVKGLRSPDAMQLDLLRTWNASGTQGFLRLRLPASMPYFFASMKVAVAASLLGAIVAELNQPAGLGARLLQGSYYGQTVQIWAALLMSALLAAVLVALVGLVERVVLRRMGLAG